MNVKPTGFLVIVKPDALDKQSSGGIALPYQPEANYDSGHILSMGPDAVDLQAKLAEQDRLKVGDHVVYHQDQKQIFEIDKVIYYIMDCRLIDGVLEGDCRLE